jgi:hypothetical protein
MEHLDLTKQANGPIFSRPDPTALLRKDVASGWDTADTPGPRASHDDAVRTVANSPSPRDLTCDADDLDVSDDADTDDDGDTDDSADKARHPASDRFVATPSAREGEPERVRDAAVAANAREVQYDGSGINRTPAGTLSDIECDIDAAMGRANRVGRNVQPTAPVARTPKA